MADTPRANNNAALNRFEIVSEGSDTPAILEYRRSGDQITLTHTEVPSALEGRGIGAALAKAALEFAREQHLRVVPACSFVAAYVKRHPEYEDLVVR